jgi:hypothetical protein
MVENKRILIRNKWGECIDTRPWNIKLCPHMNELYDSLCWSRIPYKPLSWDHNPA